MMRRRGISRSFQRAGVAVVVILLLIFFTPLVKWTAEALATDWYEGDGDVLVVLGGGMLLNGAGARATLGYNSYLRTIYASWILKAYRFPIVVVSGGDGFADAAARLLIGEGIPAASILRESRSHSTFENARYTKQLLEQHSVALKNARIAIVTSDFHTWRARRVFAKQGLPARAIPVPDVIKRSGWLPYRLEGFVTIGTELAKDVVYKMRGRI